MVSRWCHHREGFRSDEGGAHGVPRRSYTELVPRAGTNELVVRSQLLISLLPAPGALSVCSVVSGHRVGWIWGSGMAARVFHTEKFYELGLDWYGIKITSPESSNKLSVPRVLASPR